MLRSENDKNIQWVKQNKIRGSHYGKGYQPILLATVFNWADILKVAEMWFLLVSGCVFLPQSVTMKYTGTHNQQYTGIPQRNMWTMQLVGIKSRKTVRRRRTKVTYIKNVPFLRDRNKDFGYTGIKQLWTFLNLLTD